MYSYRALQHLQANINSGLVARVAYVTFAWPSIALMTIVPKPRSERICQHTSVFLTSVIVEVDPILSVQIGRVHQHFDRPSTEKCGGFASTNLERAP